MWRGKRQALSVTIEKLFGSFGFWDYVVILEYNYLLRLVRPRAVNVESDDA